MHKRYSAYKDSGIEWIGQIPSKWEVRKLKYLFSLRNGESATDERCGDRLLYGANGVIGDYPQANIFSQKIIIGRVGASGEINIAHKNSWISDNALIVDLFHRSHFKYIYYLLKSINFPERINKTAQPLITGGYISNFIAPVVDFAEQKAIADYLDCKTTQIDSLIAKKERMIELLKEERTAIINQAVTKGLNPEAKMKESGIEWLDKIPKHWEIKKLKFNAFVQFSNVNKKSEDGESSVRLCNYVDVYYNDFITPDLEFMEATASLEEINKFHLRIGDVLLTKDSEEWNDIAIPAYMTFEAPDLICGYHLAQVRPQEKVILGKYLFWLLSADCINYQFRIEASGVTRYGLSNYALSNSMCLIPPKKEQEAIATFLDKKTAQIDEQVNREQKTIELLKECRTSLISEVVTGKIDVRDEVNA